MPVIEVDSGEQWFSVEVAGETVEFLLVPEAYGDVSVAYQWAAREGLFDLNQYAADLAQDGAPAPDLFRDSAAANFAFIRRIRDWRGVTGPDGTPAPCVMNHKLRFFGKYPGALADLGKVAAERETAEIKNSLPSQPG